MSAFVSSPEKTYVTLGMDDGPTSRRRGLAKQADRPFKVITVLRLRGLRVDETIIVCMCSAPYSLRHWKWNEDHNDLYPRPDSSRINLNTADVPLPWPQGFFSSFSATMHPRLFAPVAKNIRARRSHAEVFFLQNPQPVSPKTRNTTDRTHLSPPPPP